MEFSGQRLAWLGLAVNDTSHPEVRGFKPDKQFTLKFGLQVFSWADQSSYDYRQLHRSPKKDRMLLSESCSVVDNSEFVGPKSFLSKVGADISGMTRSPNSAITECFNFSKM